MDKISDIILDVDGTLWDTTGVCARAWNAAIRENSRLEPDLGPELLKTLFGKPMDVIFAALFHGVTPGERERLAEKCCEYEDVFLKKEKIPLFEGVEETVKSLAAELPLYIVSNCQKGYIEAFLENSGLGPYITDFLCYGDTLAPKSGTMRLLIEKHSMRAPVYVGDTKGDADACRQAGVPFVYAAYGFGKVTEFWRKIEKFSELRNVVGEFD